MTHYGIDVSSNNHVTPDPLNVAGLYSYLSKLGGAQPFAIVKATQGVSYTNPFFNEDVKAFTAAGFAVGAYLMDEGQANPGEELNAFRAVAGTTPLFYDLELPQGLTVDQYKAHCAQLVSLQPAPVYLNQSMVTLGYTQGTGLWLAQYNNAPSVTSFPCIIHQYDSHAVIPDCPGQWDLNCWCASEDDFYATFRISPPIPEEPPMAGISDPVVDGFGHEHRASVFQGALAHYWRINGVWAHENVAKAADPTGPVGNIPFAQDQVPSISIVNGQLVIAAVREGDNCPFAFYQTLGQGGWGAQQILV